MELKNFFLLIKKGTTTLYFYDGDNILAEYDPQGNLETRYTFGPGIDNPLSARIGTSSYFYHLDALGSVISLTDSNKTQVASYFYDAFGFPHPSSPIPNPFLFTSREYEPESGLYYYRARYYNPEIGRFLQVDPILKLQSGECLSCRGKQSSYMVPFLLNNSQKLHFYVYVQNNPGNLTDPKGLESREECLRNVWEMYEKCHQICLDVMKYTFIICVLACSPTIPGGIPAYTACLHACSKAVYIPAIMCESMCSAAAITASLACPPDGKDGKEPCPK